jgi:shikimate dehydrogenase
MSELEISAKTSLCLLLGDPVSHSLSPKMHNAAYKATKLDFAMVASRVKAEHLKDAISGIRVLSVKGLAVTMPHKVSIIHLLDQVDPTASDIGAVNTIINVDDQLIGYNTDWLGILEPLERRIALSGISAAVLGAGGASQAAVYALTKSGAHVTVLNRTVDKAKALAAKFGADFGELSPQIDTGRYKVIINTTPLGMHESRDAAPLLSNQLADHQIVFETIYSPRETRLLKFAREVGCQVIEGQEMFLEQGAAQFKIHTGADAPREIMRSALG